MKYPKIWSNLEKLEQSSYPFEEVLVKLQSLKKESLKNNLQDEAKEIWICQTIIEIHKLYNLGFNLLKKKQYYQAWCELEKIEITINALKRHFLYNQGQYFLAFIEKAVKNLQVIYPYRVFASSEIVKISVKCSVCQKKVSVRNYCGHIVGEIYNGEMCHRIVEKAEILGISIVEDPGNKYSVAFLKDSKTDQQVDQYDYSSIDFLMLYINDPYEIWDLKVYQEKITPDKFKNLNLTDNCICNSGLELKDCCYNRIGETYPHFKFIVNKKINI